MGDSNSPETPLGGDEMARDASLAVGLPSLDYAPFRCPRCHHSLERSSDAKSLVCQRCNEAVKIAPSGIPIFSHTRYNIEGIQSTYHDDSQSTDLEARFTSYLCRNGYLDQVFPKPGRLLDLAGSDGVVGYHFMKQGYDVVLVDIVERALEVALQWRIPSVGLVDIEQPWPFSDNYFDYIFWGDNVEHLFRPLNAMKEVARTLKCGGVLACSFPNMGYWEYRRSYLWRGNVPNTEHTKKLWERDHIRHYNKSGFEEFLREANLVPRAFLPVVKPRTSRFWRISQVMSRFRASLFGQDLLAVAVKPT
jgi:SAM-dependent methyltransferase